MNVAPIPPTVQGDALQQLKATRSEAVDALVRADELEMDARAARRLARARLRNYERLLEEFAGQLRLIEDA